MSGSESRVSTEMSRSISTPDTVESRLGRCSSPMGTDQDDGGIAE
jgi:hypothetical protein